MQGSRPQGSSSKSGSGKSDKKDGKDVEKSDGSGIIKEKLTERDIQAINKYISSDSYKINEKLRSGKPLTDEEENFAKDLDAALDKMPKYDGIVYRSLSSDMITDKKTFWEQHQPGNIVGYKAYTSTSLEIYDDTMDIQCIIKSKNGKDITSYNESEKEVLFNRNSKFLISKVENSIIHMEEV